MEATPGSVCPQCGASLDAHATDRAFKVPDDVWAIAEPERAARARLNSDFCELDERCFIRGVLFLPLLDRDDDFGWGVWAEVERPVFERYANIFDADAFDEPPVTGILANVIPGYEDSANARVVIHFGGRDDRPEFVLDPSWESSLARDQHTGLDDRRYHEMLQIAGGL